MLFKYEAVERLPKVMNSGVIYHSEEFEVASLLCACGCGHKVMLLVPDSHQLRIDDGFPTVRPSISVCDAACKSHYFIEEGKTRFLRAFTPATASAVMRKQIVRHIEAQPKRLTWRERIARAVVALGHSLKTLFRG